MAQQTDEEIQMTLQTAITQYLKNPDKPPLKIVTVGKGSVGKSTLINNILRKEAAETKWSAQPVTKGVAEYQTIVNGVPVHIYDTPGLQDCSTIDEKQSSERSDNEQRILFLCCFMFHH